jgi:hypothetical protein
MTYNELVTAVQDYCENNFPTADMNTMIRQAEQNIYNTVQIANLRKNVTGSLSAGNKYLSCPADFLSVYSLAVYSYVTPTATGTSGQSTIVVSSSTGISAGMYVSGTGIGTGATVSSIVGTTVTLSVTNSGTVSGTVTFQGDYLYLLNKDVNFMREAYPNPSYRGLPKHYAIFGPQSTDVNELSFIVGPTPNLAYNAELHYYYYPESIVQSAIASLGTITGGSSYTNGKYFNVPLTGGTGSTATATIVVSSNSVSSVTISNPGVYYAVGDTLSCAASSIGGTGSGFSVPVATVSNANGTTWLGDNFDSALFNGTMMEAITYMKGEQDMVALYQNRYIQAIGLLKNLGDGKQRMDAYRDGQARNPVK